METAARYHFSDVLPLPLQDMCMLQIMTRLEEFPIQTLALLPRDIRCKLVNSLSFADVLHLQESAIFNGVEVDVLLSAASKYLVSWCLGNLKAIVRMDSFFSLRLCCTHDHPEEHVLCPELFNLFSRHYTTLGTFVMGSFIPARRFQLFACLWASVRIMTDLADCAQPLLEYCTKLSPVDEYSVALHRIMANSPLWIMYKRGFNNLQTCPLIFPALGKVLRTIQKLVFESDHSMKEIIPYVLLYNIVTSKQPQLKHFQINSSPASIAWILDSISELFHNTPCRRSLVSPNLQLTVSPPPYLLEELSVVVKNTWIGMSFIAEHVVSENACHSISTAIKAIVDFQLHNLTRVTVEGLGFCKENVIIPEYKSLLSSLSDLLKQPQACSVRVTRSPLSETFQLIETFLTTPATHKQSLEIAAIDLEEQRMLQKCEVFQPRPEGAPIASRVKCGLPLSRIQPSLSNVSFKRLNMAPSCYSVNCNISTCKAYNWLFQFSPELRLNELTMTLRHLNLVPMDIVLQIERVCFSGEYHGPTISPAHLARYIVSNTALKQLVFIDNYAGVIPALNHCLNELIQEGRGPDVIQLSPALLTSEESQVRKIFFTNVRDLSYCCGTTLHFAPVNCSVYRQLLSNSFVSSLGYEFKDRKIKQVVYTPSRLARRDIDPVMTLLLPIAETVIVRAD